MNLHLIAHDPETGRVQLYTLALAAVIERTGREDTFGRHEVQVRQTVGRDFVDTEVGTALAEVLQLDPSTFGEVGWAEQQKRLRREAEGGESDG